MYSSFWLPKMSRKYSQVFSLPSICSFVCSRDSHSSFSFLNMESSTLLFWAFRVWRKSPKRTMSSAASLSKVAKIWICFMGGLLFRRLKPEPSGSSLCIFPLKVRFFGVVLVYWVFGVVSREGEYRSIKRENSIISTIFYHLLGLIKMRGIDKLYRLWHTNRNNKSQERENV